MDHLESTRVLLDDNGKVVGTSTMSHPVAVTGVDTRKGFIDKENNEETDLSNHGVRQYSPKSGRFVSVDPLWEKFPSQTPYHYSFNNPVVLVDGNGKNPTGGAISIGIGLGEAAITSGLVAIGVASAESIDRFFDGASYEGAVLYEDEVDYFLGIGNALELSNGKTMSIPLGAQLDGEVAWNVVLFIVAMEGGGEDHPVEPESSKPDNPPVYPVDPTKAPDADWTWRGDGAPGSGQGNWVNDKTQEKLHPELGPNKHGPHWDYVDPQGRNWRLYPDGSNERKMRRGKPQ